MTIIEWIIASTKNLTGFSSTARLDAEVLLANVLGKDRAWLLAHPDYLLQGLSLQKADEFLKRRLQSEPVAYIVGYCEFYGRDFVINKHTLVPRPESETMIELLLKITKDTPTTIDSIIDVGTGSGALGITAALELLARGRQIKTTLLDIDEKCLDVARRNALNYQIEANYFLGNLLSPLVESALDWRSMVILANLPYVPNSHPINDAAKHEPKHAIFGGTDGLNLYRQMFEQLQKMQNEEQGLKNGNGMLVFTESLPDQHDKLATIATSAGYRQFAKQDLIQAYTPI